MPSEHCPSKAGLLFCSSVGIPPNWPGSLESMRNVNRLNQLVRHLIKEDSGLTPVRIADEALRQLDPKREAPELVRLACKSHLRQMAKIALYAKSEALH